MSLCKMDKSLKELHKKLEEERMLRELPGLVAGIEDAMCEPQSGTKRLRGRTTTMDKLLELLEKLVRAIFGPGDELRQPQPRDGTSYSVEGYHYY